jgi:phage tail-like protein
MTDRPVDPYLRHRFAVDLGDDRPPLGFAEVTGLSVRVRTEAGDEDDGPDWLHWRDRPRGAAIPAPARRRTASPPLRLRRGVTDDRRLWDWLRDWVDGAATPRTVRVFLLDEAGERARGWRCRAATPVRWAGPELVADRPGVATETLELAHEGIDAIDPDGG